MKENPLNEDSGVSNPLEEEVGANSVEPETQVQTEQEQPMTEEDAILATATEQPPFVNECQEEGGASMNRWRSRAGSRGSTRLSTYPKVM